MSNQDRFFPRTEQKLYNDVKWLVDSVVRAPESFQAVAPHLIKIADSGFMASPRYCMIQGLTIVDHRARLGGHRILFFNTEFVVEELYIKAIKDFMDYLEVYNVYELQIARPTDNDGKFALVTVLCAVWEMVKDFEIQNIVKFEEKGVLKAMEHVFDKHGLDKTELSAAINATFDTDGDSIHLIYQAENMEVDEDEPSGTNEADEEEMDEDDDKTKIDLSFLRKKYEFVFMKTSMHTSKDTSYHSKGSVEIAESLQDAIENEKEVIESDEKCFDGLETMLSSYFMAKRRRSPGATIETVIETVLTQLENFPKPASDSSSGGTIMFMEKKALEENKEIFRTIAKGIYDYLGEEKHGLTVSYLLMNKVEPAGMVVDPLCEEFGSHELVSCHFNWPILDNERVVENVVTEQNTNWKIGEGSGTEGSQDGNATDSTYKQEHEASYDDGPDGMEESGQSGQEMRQSEFRDDTESEANFDNERDETFDSVDRN